MPTMTSIGMDQSLVERLAGIGSSTLPGLVAGDPNQKHQQHGSWMKNSNNGQQQPHLVIPIRTPQALLSRDPTAVASGLGITVPEALNLRSAVADATTAGCGVGREAADLVGDVSRSIAAVASTTRRRRKRLRVAAEQEDGRGGSCGGREKFDDEKKTDDDCIDNDNDRDGTLLFHRRRPPPVVVGAVTALDMCIHSALLAEAGPSALLVNVGTGSARLDSLLAPDDDLADGGASTRIYHSLVLPPKTNPMAARQDDPEAGDFFGPDTLPTQQDGGSGGAGGVRLGYVTEVYGPPSSGKTQLALTLAANAAVKGWTVHYLGGGGSASVLPLARRLKSLCQSRVSSDSNRGERHRQTLLRTALERVGFVSVQDGHCALAALADIEKETTRSTSVAPPPSTRDGREDERSNNNLIIFDSASGCLSSDLFADGDGGVGAALVEDVGFVLKKMSRTIGANDNDSRRCRYAVFVVNGTVSASSGNKAALGTGWRAADVQVRLDVLQDELPQHDEQQRVPGLTVSKKRTIKATLMKHYAKSVTARDGDASTSTTFAITANGIVDDA